MTRLTDTQRAYIHFSELLDLEIANSRADARQKERFRETLDAAFYFLGWAQFEYLVREEVRAIAEREARSKSRVRLVWEYLRDSVKEYSVRRRLEFIFFDRPTIINKLNKDYSVRNEIAHEYKPLPKEARDVANWL